MHRYANKPRKFTFSCIVRVLRDNQTAKDATEYVPQRLGGVNQKQVTGKKRTKRQSLHVKVYLAMDMHKLVFWSYCCALDRLSMTLISKQTFGSQVVMESPNCKFKDVEHTKCHAKGKKVSCWTSHYAVVSSIWRC